MNYNLKFRLFETNTGIVYQMEEEQQGQQKKNYYAFDLAQDYEECSLKKEEILQGCSSVRQFIKSINYQNQRYFLFTYSEGQTLDQQISIFRGKKESISLDTIKNYLTQILETLYQLHKQYILGRVFSTKNIIDCNGQILFLDFGFGPKILSQNIDLIAPPEIIEKFIENQSYNVYYDMKIDSWLLGAVLFNLVKLRSINAMPIGENKLKNMLFNDVSEYWLYLKKQMEKSEHIESFTQRYPEELCQLIQGLLTYKNSNRLSFQQIYNSEFIKSLNLPRYNEYLLFYEKYDEKKLNEKITINEVHDSVIIDTRELQTQNNRGPFDPRQITPHGSNAYMLDLNNVSKLVSQTIVYPGTSSRLLNQEGVQDGTSYKSQEGDQEDIEKSFVYQISGLAGSKFYLLWSHVRMELFRYTFLEKTAEEFQVELKKKKNFELENVLAYFLNKMGYLILIELQKKINEDVCPWRSNQYEQQNWKDFQKENQKQILENAITKKIQELGSILKESYSKHCEIYLKEEKIDVVIRNELKADQMCFQSQTITGNSIYTCCSDEFLRNGYRQLLELTSKYLERENRLDKSATLKYNTLLLKILICYLINRIFNLSNTKATFEGLLKGRKKIDLISPHEIYSYICRDDESKKGDDIKHIQKINFNHE